RRHVPRPRRPTGRRRARAALRGRARPRHRRCDPALGPRRVGHGRDGGRARVLATRHDRRRRSRAGAVRLGVDARDRPTGDADDRGYRAERPVARIGEDFVGRGRVEVFTVRSPREDYWRVAALDRYESTNGGQWTLAARGEDEVQDGLHAPVDSSMLRQEFHITGLADRWLPAAYEPVQLEGGDDPLVVKASSTLVSNRSDVS